MAGSGSGSEVKVKTWLQALLGVLVRRFVDLGVQCFSQGLTGVWEEFHRGEVPSSSHMNGIS